MAIKRLGMDSRLRIVLAVLLVGVGMVLLLALGVQRQVPPGVVLAGDGDNLHDDLVGWWDFEEESGTRYDSHTTNHDLTDNNTVVRAAGKIDYAADFDDTNSEHFTISDSAFTAYTDDLTIAAWIEVDDASGYQMVISKWMWGSNEYRLDFNYNGGSPKFEWWWAPSLKVEKSVATMTGVWYFVVVWRDATGDRIYIQVNDGVASNYYHADISNNLASGSVLYFGRSDGTYYDGRQDSVAIWRRVLSSAERTWLYNSGSGRNYSDIPGGAATDTPTPMPTDTATPTPTDTSTPTPTYGTPSIYTITLPNGGEAHVTAESDFAGLLTILGLIAIVAILIFVFMFDLSRLGSRIWR